ncbi:MAG: hypothetical protein WBH50_09010 [Fuerstiella sp.]
MNIRLFIFFCLLISLFAASADCVGIGMSGDAISETSDPLVPEEEEAESSGEAEFEKLRHCDFHARITEEAFSRCDWHRLSLEANLLPELLACKTQHSRGPPTA